MPPPSQPRSPDEICILAGGLSSRFGRDKSRLQLGGRTLLDRIRAAAEPLNAPIRVIRRDSVPRCGPLGGILTAFRTSRADRILFLSCDMPFVSTALLRRLADASARFAVPVFIRQNSGIGFPFVLRRTMVPLVESAIEGNDLSLQSLARKSRARTMRLSRVESGELCNINTSSDWKEAGNNLKRRTVLEVQEVQVQRGGFDILDRINWRVESGQHWVVLGANGSGKTSLLSVLTGYLTPTGGEVSLLGKDFGAADWRELRRKVGLVSSSIRQWMAEAEPALHTVVSGKFAMIDFWGKAARSDVAKARAILRQIECAHLEDRPWGCLSQGERQRVLIGRALMARPRLLILDEPCAGLDPAAREHFIQFIEHLARRANGPALILVTHHVEEITPAFSHVLILKKGRVLASGAKARILNSATLSTALETPTRLHRNRGRYTLTVAPAKRTIC